MEATFKPLGSNSVFLLDLDGHKVIALKLPSKVANEVSGQKRHTSGILGRLKAKLGLTPESEQWLTVTSVDNPLLQEYDKFGALVAQELTTATGTTITETDLAISASIPIEDLESDENAEIEYASSKPGINVKSDATANSNLSKPP